MHRPHDQGVALASCRSSAFTPSTSRRDSEFDGHDGSHGERRFGGPAPRIALYSHDALGLGHMRRNLLIADSLASSGAARSVLLIAGAHRLGAFPMPPNTDCLTLPALCKQNGSYRSRSLRIATPEIVALRAQTIRAALASFQADVFIVDKLPRGVLNELEPTLDDLRQGGKTRIVLGLRDILDDPTAVRLEWGQDRADEAIRDYYDAVWIYGDPTVYDTVTECHLGADTSLKVRFSGYLQNTHGARRPGRADDSISIPGRWQASGERLNLCLVGGGEDGGKLAEAFAHAIQPPGTHGLILTGPYMPALQRQQLQALASSRADLSVLEFLSDPTALVQAADRVVAMGGYNTIVELLAHRKCTLIVPRVQPRKEQLIRATRLCELGFIEMVHPAELSPERLSLWLDAPPSEQSPDCAQIDLDGLHRLPRFVEDLLGVPAGLTGAS